MSDSIQQLYEGVAVPITVHCAGLQWHNFCLWTASRKTFTMMEHEDSARIIPKATQRIFQVERFHRETSCQEFLTWNSTMKPLQTYFVTPGKRSFWEFLRMLIRIYL